MGSGGLVGVYSGSRVYRLRRSEAAVVLQKYGETIGVALFNEMMYSKSFTYFISS